MSRKSVTPTFFYIVATSEPLGVGQRLAKSKPMTAELIPLAEVNRQTHAMGQAPVASALAYDVTTFCQLTAMSKATFFRCLKAGTLKARVRGGKNLILAEDAHNFLQSLPEYRPDTCATDRDECGVPAGPVGSPEEGLCTPSSCLR